MPNYRRAAHPGGTYFFTVNTFRRQPVLTDEPFRAALRQARHSHPPKDLPLYNYQRNSKMFVKELV